ncbi:hypothetical protein MSAN_02247200 [Mycena sanguinolenta]|uniref:SAM domain-containing protein n=1 Tax=Mycena sanguinolenta TaxID=230812 RepID=A0A8H7CIP9_9AGAR|nr:hypothetical protein MSAN_02247200 [Mycena sanguinolenta]
MGKRKEPEAPNPEPPQPVKRGRGRPPKAKPDAEKPISKSSVSEAPASKSSSSSSSSDSDVVFITSTDSSARSWSPLTDIDAQDIQDATEGLLGLAEDRRAKKAQMTESSKEEDPEESPKDKKQRKKVVMVDEDDKEEDDYEEPAEPTSVELLVPVDGAADTWDLDFDTDWDDFLDQISDMTGIRVCDLKLGYRLSTTGAKDPLRVLARKSHLERLIADSKKELTHRSKMKTQPKRDFHVVIGHLNAEEVKKGKGVEKKTGKEPKKGRSRRKAPEDSDDDDDDAEGPKKKSRAEYHRELEAARACEKHGGHCVVAENGEHVALSMQNLSLWSVLMAEGSHDSLLTPPVQLGLNIQSGSKAAAPSRRKQDPPPPPAQFPFPYPPYHHYPFFPPPGHGPYPGAAYPPPPPLPPVSPPPPPVQSKLRRTPSAEAYDDPTIYPKISEWLLDLDTSPRGEDGDQFRQYADAFANEGFKRIVELQDKTEDILRRICPGMTTGIAGKLMKYVQIDCRKARQTNKEFFSR